MRGLSLKKKVLQLLKVIEQVESEAVGAVVLVAVLAVKSFLLSLCHVGAIAALYWRLIGSSHHHALVLVLATRSVSI